MCSLSSMGICLGSAKCDGKLLECMKQEVDKLFMVGYITEVFYPDWLANVMTMKMENGKWYMCVHFTNLNK